MIDTTTPRDSWSNFWRTSPHGAIDLQADDPIADSLRRHWLEQLPWLQTCKVVLDLGSGPAVLPRGLRALSPPLPHPEWICIDHARVPADNIPTDIRLFDGLDFGTSSPPAGQALPSAVVSNFGMEYVEPAALAAGCARWLAPGGRVHAVVHARGSIIDQVSATAADDIGWALDDVGLFEAVDALLTVCAALPEDAIDRMMHGVRERDAYNDAVNRLKQRMDARGAVSAALMEMLENLRALIALALGGQGGDARVALRARHDALRGEIMRLRDMQRCALDPDRLGELQRALASVGIALQPASLLVCAHGTVAWILAGRRT